MSVIIIACQILALVFSVHATPSPPSLDVSLTEVVTTSLAGRVPSIVDFLLMGQHAIPAWRLSYPPSAGLEPHEPASRAPHAVVLVTDKFHDTFEALRVAEQPGCSGVDGEALAAHAEGGVVAVLATPGSRRAALSVVSPSLRRRYDNSTVIVVLGSGEAGVRAAVAALMRSVRMQVGVPRVPAALCGAHAPPPWFHMRGHQMTNWAFTFKSWTAAEQYVRELVTFGTNFVEFAHIVRKLLRSIAGPP